MQGAPFGCLVAGQPVNTEFKVLSATHLCAEIPDMSEARHVTVFALSPPALPEGAVFAVYLQRASQQPVIVGALCPGNLALTTAPRKSVGRQEGSYQGFVHVLLQDAASTQEQLAKASQAAGDARPASLLSRIAEKVYDDFEKFVGSHDDVELQGRHYVSAAAVDSWIAAFDRRVRMNGRFWADIE